MNITIVQYVSGSRGKFERLLVYESLNRRRSRWATFDTEDTAMTTMTYPVAHLAHNDSCYMQRYFINDPNKSRIGQYCVILHKRQPFSVTNVIIIIRFAYDHQTIQSKHTTTKYVTHFVIHLAVYVFINR